MKNLKKIYVSLLLSIVSSLCTVAQVVYVDDFGAIPNDGKDDAPAIRQAFQKAKEIGAKEIIFNEGTYHVISTQKYENGQTYHSAIFNLNTIDIKGAVDKNGAPATHIIKFNPQHSDGRALKTIFKFGGCSNISFKNITIDNYPKSSTSAKVLSKGEDYIEVKVLEGMPFFEGMPIYCANAWDLETKTLKHVPSLTYGKSPAKWKLIDKQERIMRLDGIRFSHYLEPGDGISWHLGARNTPQVYFDNCEDVNIENVAFYNGDGFVLTTSRCKNIYGNKVMITTNKKNQLAVGPRDAWKMHSCDGEALIENSHFEGVRWDGQNVHGTFLFVDKIIGKNQFLAYGIGRRKDALKPQPIGIWKKNNMSRFNAKEIEFISRHPELNRSIYKVTTHEDLGESTVEGSLITLYGYDLDKYVLKNVSIKSIAGTGSVIKNENVTIDNCTYENIMYPAINMGTEHSLGNWIEGTFPVNVLIQNSKFVDCGWQKKLGVMGAIGIGNGWDYPHMGRMKNIHIKGNLFKDCFLGIEVEDAEDVFISDNTFINVCKAWNINTLESKNVKEENNTIIKR